MTQDSHQGKGGSYMSKCVSHLAAFGAAVAAGESTQFEGLVKVAYARGCSREDLFSVVEIGRVLGRVSGSVISRAYATIHAWHWIAVRQTLREEVVPTAGTTQPLCSLAA
jgi:alkylhydroperoxidase/carboxymuconolactone decarboxylase family protein YurZ